MLYRIPQNLSCEERGTLQKRSCDICIGKQSIYGLVNGLVTRVIPNDPSVALSFYSQALGGKQPVNFGLYTFDSFIRTLTLDHIEDDEAGFKDRMLRAITARPNLGKLNLGLNQQEIIDAYHESKSEGSGSLEEHYLRKASPIATIFRQAAQCSGGKFEEESFEFGSLLGAQINIEDDLQDVPKDFERGKYNPAGTSPKSVMELKDKFVKKAREVFGEISFSDANSKQLFQKIAVYPTSSTIVNANMFLTTQKLDDKDFCDGFFEGLCWPISILEGRGPLPYACGLMCGCLCCADLCFGK